MNNVVFHLTPPGEVMLGESPESMGPYTEENTVFTESMWRLLETDFPNALRGLCRPFGNRRPQDAHFRFYVIRRFILCNFGLSESYIDPGNIKNYRFDLVPCSLHAACPHSRQIRECGEKKTPAVCKVRFEHPPIEQEGSGRLYYELNQVTAAKLRRKLFYREE